MTVYVDVVLPHHDGTSWAHLWADDGKELDAFATGLGIDMTTRYIWLSAGWKRARHYHVSAQERVLALEHGAVEGSTANLVWRKQP